MPTLINFPALFKCFKEIGTDCRPSWLIVALLICTSCCETRNSIHTDDQLDFSYQNLLGTGEMYSVKVSHSDTLFLRQHYSNGLREDFLPDSTTYFTRLSKADKAEIDHLISKLSASSLDTSAVHSYSTDVGSYDICLYGEHADREFYADGDTYPALKLYSKIQLWFEEVRKTNKFVPIDTVIHFKSGQGVTYPAWKTEFLPPEIEVK